jgi:hypothetical protein
MNLSLVTLAIIDAAAIDIDKASPLMIGLTGTSIFIFIASLIT